MLEQVLYGFSVALTPENLLYCFLGCMMGTLVGVLPGIGPMAAMSLLFGATLKILPFPESSCSLESTMAHSMGVRQHLFFLTFPARHHR